MADKITWKDIYKDFCKRYPRLCKVAVDHRPCDFMAIKVYLEDGTVMKYDMMTSRVTVLDEIWKKGE